MLCIQIIKIKDLISITQIKILKCSNINNNKCLNNISKIYSSNNSRNIFSTRDSSSSLIITHNNSNSNNSSSKTILKTVLTIIIWDITITWILANSSNTSRC